LSGLSISNVVGNIGENAGQKRRHAEERHQLELELMQAKIAQEIIAEKKLQPVKVAAKGALLISAVVGAFLGGFQVIALLKKRSMLVYPGQDGQYPLLRIRLKNRWGEMAEVTFDPNRSVGAANIFTLAEDGNPLIVPVVTGQLQDALMTTRQAQAVQLVRAAVSGNGDLKDSAVNVARRWLPEERPTLPAVRVMATAAPGVERLIAEARANGAYTATAVESA
jgi:hypothetical protein